MGYRFGWILVITLFAIVTMTAGGKVATFQANTAGHTARQFIQFHVEATFPCVAITIASCKIEKRIGFVIKK